MPENKDNKPETKPAQPAGKLPTSGPEAKPKSETDKRPPEQPRSGSQAYPANDSTPEHNAPNPVEKIAGREPGSGPGQRPAPQGEPAKGPPMSHFNPTPTRPLPGANRTDVPPLPTGFQGDMSKLPPGWIPLNTLEIFIRAMQVNPAEAQKQLSAIVGL